MKKLELRKVQLRHQGYGCMKEVEGGDMNELELSMTQLRYVTQNVAKQLERRPEKVDWAKVDEDMAFARTLFDRAYKEVQSQTLDQIQQGIQRVTAPADPANGTTPPWTYLW